MENSTRGYILESLQSSHVLEAVAPKVKSDLNKFFSDAKVSGTNKTNIRNILNGLFQIFNSYGKNNFDKSELEFTKGTIDDSDYNNPEVIPSSWELRFVVFFDSLNSDDMVSLLRDELKKLYKYCDRPDEYRQNGTINTFELNIGDESSKEYSTVSIMVFNKCVKISVLHSREEF